VPGTPDSSAVLAKVRRRLIPFLFLLYIVAYLDRINVGFAALQMNAALGLSATAYGLGSGIFFLSYTLFEVPSNVLLVRIGARLWIARIMITWGLVSTGMMLIRGPWHFYALRFLLGAAEAGFFPGIIFYLTRWFPTRERARTIAAFMTAVLLAGIVGGPASGALLSLHGAGGLAGWQWLFLLEGLPSVVVGILVLFYLDDNPSKSKWLTGEEKGLLLTRLEQDEQAKRAQGEQSHSFADAFRNGRVWIFCAIYFGIVMGTYGISFWLPQIIKETITKDPFHIGLISAIPWAAAAIAMVVNGHHSDATGERRWHVAGACIIGAVAFAISAMPGVGGWAGIAALTVATAAVMSAVSCFWSLPTGILSGTAAAAGIAWINSVGNLAGYVSPTVVGKIRDATHSMTLALSVLSVSVLIAALLVIYVTSMKPKEVAGRTAAQTS
jgi:D-galactonate transporter